MTQRLAVQHRNGDITVPTAYGEIRLPRDSFSWIHGRTILRIRKRVRREPQGDTPGLTLKRGRVLISNLKAEIFEIKKNLLKARRALAHIVHGYGWDDMFSNEGELRRMVEVVAQSPVAMYLLCNYSKMTPKQIETYRAMCDQLMANIGRPRNEYKVEMSWRTKKAHSLTDSLGRNPNYVVSQFELRKVTELGELRIDEIRAIVKFMDRRQPSILAEIAAHWRQVHFTHAKMAGLITAFGSAKTIPVGVVDDLNDLIRQLESCDDMPWIHSFERSITDDIKPAIVWIEKRQKPLEAVRYFQRVKVAMEMLQLLRLMADLVMLLSVELRRRKPNKDALTALLARFTEFHSMIPVEIRDGEIHPTVDKHFRGGSVAVRLYELIQDGIDLMKAGKPRLAKEKFSKAEEIF
ncbi:MAG: hypothetical protein ABH846_03175 [Patescibacteria group bacterium]